MPDARKPRRTLIAACVVAGALIGTAGVYGIGRFQSNPDSSACAPAQALAKRIAPLIRGEVAAVTPAASPLRVPDLAFRDASGAEKRLSDWRGRTLLLNLWATWCVPCRQEMPALDALQARLGGADFEVVAINIDPRDPQKPKAWFDEVGLKRLGFYTDTSAKVFTDLKMIGRAFGMPTTLLIDPASCEIGTIAGPAEWASEDATRLVTAALGK